MTRLPLIPYLLKGCLENTGSKYIAILGDSGSGKTTSLIYLWDKIREKKFDAS